MSASLALLHGADASPLDRTAAFQALRKMVLNSVASEHSKRNYAKALDEVFALCEERKQPLSRALLMEYRAAMLEKKLSASTVNVRLSAVRKLIGEAQRNGIIGVEEAANLSGVPNLSQKGTRAGNWLTREQAKELLTVPDRSKINKLITYSSQTIVHAKPKQILSRWSLLSARFLRDLCPDTAEVKHKLIFSW